MNIVLPDQRGQLPNDPSCANVGHLGVEFEYVQGDISQFAWRGRLADDGIFTWQTGVAPREIIAGTYTIPDNVRRFIHSVQDLYEDNWGAPTSEAVNSATWLHEAFPRYFGDGDNRVIRSNGRYTSKFTAFANEHLWETGPKPPPNPASPLPKGL